MSSKTVALRYDYLFKFIIIGNAGVGKSCLLQQWVDESFLESHISTIGIDFKMKSVTHEGKRIRIQLWDTAGQDRFRTITPIYYRNSVGVIIAYDVTDRESFNKVTSWIQSMEASIRDEKAPQQIHKIIVGNKCDNAAELRQVSFEEGKKLADTFNAGFFETSAKTGFGVNETFTDLVDKVYKKLHNSGGNVVINKNGVVSFNTPKKKDNACCK